MPYQATTAIRKIARLDKRVRVIQGGARAGKSFAILMILIATAQDPKNKGKVISVVSETVPHLKRGVMRDFKNIMTEHNYWKDARWNASDFIYTFETGAILEFFSADSSAKVRGPARNILFINECNNINYETYTQLILRTSDYAYLDYNPVAEFWVHTDVIPRDDAEMIILTYKDNEGLAPAIIEEIESRRANKNFWRVYGLGLIGEAEGKIFTNWQIIDSVPHEARLEVRGGDFGYARDPTAFCDIYYYNGGYIIDELCYRVGFKDPDLAQLLLNQEDPNVLAIVDSADKQKVDLLQTMGVNVLGVEKRGTGGDHFTNAAIGFVQSQKISITKRSVNYIKSYRNFMWATDKDGNILPKYDHYMSDGMMSVVYGMTGFDPARRLDEDEESVTTGNLAALWN
jgi:phage terminase large subunit